MYTQTYTHIREMRVEACLLVNGKTERLGEREVIQED